MKATLKYLFALYIILLYWESCSAQFQDTTYTKSGFTIDYPHLHCRMDTIRNVNQMVSFYRGKHYFTVKINGQYLYKDVPLRFGEPLTIYSVHSEIIVTKRKFRFTYKV